jgi:hypothetical protein
MDSVYLFRHQHGGFDSSMVFATKPTDEQMAALNARADATFGPGWSLAVEVPLLTDATVLNFETSNADSEDPGTANLGIEYSLSATGTVTEAP